MGKKLIALFLVLAMVLSLCTVTVFATPCNSNSGICGVEADLFGGVWILHQIAKLLVDRTVDVMHLARSSLLCPIKNVQTAAKVGAAALGAAFVGHILYKMFKGCQPASPTDPEPVTYYTVTFDLNGVGIVGTAPATKTIIRGGKIDKPATPTALNEKLSFAGWDTVASPSTLVAPWDFDNNPVTEDMTLYAKWDSECIAAGTMITMGDGEQTAVEELKIGDVIRTFDHETGEVSSAPVCFIWESKNVANAFTLTFEGGIEVTVIEEHGFYDKEEQKYAFINAQNAKDYIGHHFYDADNDSWIELLG